MAAVNRLRELIENPGSFTGTPGYQFARDQAMHAAERGMSRTRGSGNALAELTRLGAGYASQDYGNEVDRLTRIAGQDQQFELGQEGNRINATRVGNDFTLGTQTNENTRRRGDQDYGLGLYRAGNDFTLGTQQNRNAARRTDLDWWNAGEDQASRRRREALDWWDRYNRDGG